MASQFPVSASVSLNFEKQVQAFRPALHSSGFCPLICSCSEQHLADVRAMHFWGARTHDWALINPNERVCDWHHLFPLPHLDATKSQYYHFDQTDYLLGRVRDLLGEEIFFRMGTSIEHSGPKVHFNALIPEDFDKVAEVFAGTIRHYNCGWGKDGKKWGIKYWEIWNEPDGHNNMWCLPDGDEPSAEKDPVRREKFCEFFVKVLKRLKGEFGDSIKVGGPALCWMNPEYFSAIFDACKKAGVKPDFISWHHYCADPGIVMNSIKAARELCDSYGFTDCELIINEWHFFGEYGWGDLRSTDPAIKASVWEGPAGHSGIDSSCFNLTLLSRFQTSALDQAYYYGCRSNGDWGYMDPANNKLKVFYGLKMFGQMTRFGGMICESKSDTAGVTGFALKDKHDGHHILVTDFRAGVDEIKVDLGQPVKNEFVNGIFHDFKNDWKRVRIRVVDGKLTIRKNDSNSAACYFWF